MFSIAPISFGDDSPGTSRTSHLNQEQIEALIVRSVDEVLNQWKQYKAPLGPKTRCARNLLAAVDHFLSNGCLEGSRTYWRFLKEFLPASHRRYFQKEFRIRTDRDLCIVWLKDSFNNKVLPSYFQSFLSNWVLIRKHYMATAMIRKRSVSKRMVEKIFDIVEVEFSFVIPEVVPIAIIRSPQSSGQGPQSPSHQRINRRKKAFSEAEEVEDAAFSAISDVQIAPDLVENPPDPHVVPFLTTAKDFDYVVTEIIQKGEKRMPTTTSLPERLNAFQGTSRTAQLRAFPPDAGKVMKTKTKMDRIMSENIIEDVVDPFEKALETSLSHAKLVSSRKTELPPKKMSSSPFLSPDSVPFGEVSLDHGEVAGLLISVFKRETEKFQRFFQVYEGFGTGHPQQRFLVLSDRSLYLLSLENSTSKQKLYYTWMYLPLKNIEFIAVSPDYQVLFIHAEKGYSFNESSGGLQAMEICTACSQLGKTIVHAVGSAYCDIASLGSRELTIFTESTAHHFILNKFMARELREVSVELKCYTFAQWRQTSIDCPGGNGVQHSGYLYHKTLRIGSWLMNTGESQQSFFHLQNQKLYQFSDSTCKVGERVISIQDTVSNIIKVPGDESGKKFELEFQNGERIHFQCQSRVEMEKWLLLLTSIIFSTSKDSKEIEAPACFVAISNKNVLIAQEGENCVVDGFMRMLAIIPIAEVSKAIGVLARERYACVLNNGKELNWLFLRSPDEVDRVLAVFQQLEVPKICREEDGSSRLVALVNSLPQSGDLFYFEDVHSDDSYEAV